MKERQVCWGARDLYWRCLDDNAEDAARCQQLRSSFEASCPQQWVSPVGYYNTSLHSPHLGVAVEGQGHGRGHALEITS